MTEPAAKYDTGADKPAPLPCPFCGCTELHAGFWHLDDGEVDAWECSQCFAGAPVTAWNTRHIEWHYPQSNLDTDNMPAPGQIVVAFYYDGESIRGPVITTPVGENGPVVDAKGFSVYCPIVRWHAIPEEQSAVEPTE